MSGGNVAEVRALAGSPVAEIGDGTQAEGGKRPADRARRSPVAVRCPAAWRDTRHRRHRNAGRATGGRRQAEKRRTPYGAFSAGFRYGCKN